MATACFHEGARSQQNTDIYVLLSVTLINLTIKVDFMNKNKDFIQAFNEDFWNKQNLAAFEKYFTSDFISHYPDMDMISFGPNIRGAHSPDEKVQISSVQKYWQFFLETLSRTPAKT